MAKTKLTTPRHLKGDARRWFAEMLDTYAGWESEPHSVAMLVNAAKQLQRAQAYREIIDAEGVAVTDRFGQTREHPCLAGERACHNQHRLLCRDLGITPAPASADESVRTPRILRA